PPTDPPPTDPPPTGGNLALGRPVTATSSTQNYVAANTVDGNAASYWESANNSFPQSVTVDLGAARHVDRVVLKLPAGWERRTQTLAVLGSTDGSSWATLAGSAGRTFDPASGNTVSVALPAGDRRFVRLTFTANTGWPAGQLAEFEVYGDGSTPPPTDPPTGNLAAGRPISATSHADVYVAGNAVDGNANTYWESANSAFPQSVTVDLGSARPVSRLVLKLPPAPAWQTRTQTLAVLGSTDGSSFSTLKSSAGYTFDPASGNTVSIPVPAGDRRFVRLTLTGNTGWPAGQLAEFEVYAT
ncbi:discoidin domain-containing protein, partial [Micromonospora sp. 15K316]|uniref:discoidin domain-containing protein n=1 Tax=Micromonospora sp. 15K316 TaxID=2530376 RepID=UPI00104B5118